MRLYEAYFLDEFRDDFMKRNDSLSRRQLDAANSSSERKITFVEKITAKYNDEKWVPVSQVFASFHSELATSFHLPLVNKLTEERVTQILVDVRAQYNQALFNYKQSGNGKSNRKKKDGSVVDGEEFGDDTRWDFVQRRGIHVGYYWCLVDKNGLEGDCSQNCTLVGISSSGGDISVVTSKKRKRKSDAIECFSSIERSMKRTEEMTRMGMQVSGLESNLLRMEKKLMVQQVALDEDRKLEVKW